MKDLIVPRTLVDVKEKPILFFYGPKVENLDWQNKSLEYLSLSDKDFYVAFQSKMSEQFSKSFAKGKEEFFPKDCSWANYYSDLAAKKGAILFWLLGEENAGCLHPYGIKTKIKLEQWMTLYGENKSINLFVGGEKTFPEFESIRNNFLIDFPEKKFYFDLEDMCKDAVNSLRKYVRF